MDGDWTLWPAMVAAVIGAVLGVIGLVSPGTAAKIVRLQADPAFTDGVAEFRASFGGLFLLTHGACLAALGATVTMPALAQATAIVCFSAALIWLGTALGRMVALVVERAARTPYQMFATGFELLLGAMLALPAAFLSAAV